jgi:hypothetical protein
VREPRFRSLIPLSGMVNPTVGRSSTPLAQQVRAAFRRGKLEDDLDEIGQQHPGGSAADAGLSSTGDQRRMQNRAPLLREDGRWSESLHRAVETQQQLPEALRDCCDPLAGPALLEDVE